MKIITEPTVHVLSVPLFFPHPEYEVPEVVGRENDPTFDFDIKRDAYSIIAHAGKGCYDSYGKDGRSIEDHINSLITTRHGSVLEHVNIGLFITGISRGCSHEIVRHRHFSYSQRSTRYTSEEEAAIVLDPYYTQLKNKYAGNNDLPRTEDEIDEYNLICEFEKSCVTSLQEYAIAVKHLMNMAPSEKSKVEKRKWARGKARQLLPHALETRMTMTGNIRAWRWFLEERSSRFSEPEIRRLSNKIFDTLSNCIRYCFEDYTKNLIDGYYEYLTEYRKI